MQLVSIETTNFKKLRRFRAEFTGGLNVIVGDNAQGKSTLLQAIECALYGASVVPGKKDKIPTWGQSSWKVELVFSLDGADYRLTRSKSTAKLERSTFDGDELVANGNTPVTAAVAELLDLDAKDYNLFMQSKQGETSGVLTFGATALNKKVEAFAGISLIDRVISLAQEEYRVEKAQADALAVSDEVIKAAEEWVDLKSDEALDAEKALKDAQESFEELPDLASLSEPEVDPEALRSRANTVAKLRTRVEKAQIEVDNAKRRYQEALQRFEELEKPEDAEELASQLNQLNRECKSSVARVNELSRQLDSRQRLWDQLVKAEKVMDDDIPEDEIGEELSDTVEKIGEVEKRSQDATRRWHEADHRLQQIEEMREGAECPACGTQLSEHDPAKLDEEHSELTAKRDATKAERDDLDKQYRSLDRHRRALEKQLEEAQAHEAEVDRLRETLIQWPSREKLEEDYRIADEVHTGNLSEKAALEHRIEQLEGKQRIYRRAERAVKTEYSSLREMQGELEELEGQLAAGEAEGVPTEEDIEAARKAWRQFEADRNELRHKRLEAKHAVDTAEERVKHTDESLNGVRKELDSLREKAEKSKAASKTADAAGRLSRFLRERRSGYLQEVWDAVLAAASKQVNMASKGMISRLVYDDGDFLFEEEGILAPVASASGAQKAHIGVALRIGLSRALYGSDALIIFDEPTESMSEHHAAGLSASLAGAAQQCLLITHREQDQDLATNVIEVAA